MQKKVLHQSINLTAVLKDSPIGRHEHRPWGWFFVLHENANEWTKLLIVQRNQSLSLQSHNYREEKWVVINGSMIVELDGEQHILREGESIVIPLHAKHRARGLEEDCAWIEYAKSVAGPCSEDDIVRYKDKYGRADLNK